MEVRSGYKQTEVGLIPRDWVVKPLGDLASVTAGGTPSRTVAKYWNGDIPWITTSEIDFYTIDHAEQFVTKEGLNNSAAKLLPRGTLLMALYGQGKTRGKVGILGIDAATNQASAAILIKGNVSQEFLFHYLASQYDAIRNLSNTGNQENLNGTLVRSISVLLPPLPEQRAIAVALTDVDALLGGLDRLIAKKRDLKQAVMQQLLTGQTRLPGFHAEWEVKRLGDIARFLAGTYLAQDDYRDGEYEIQGAGSVMGRHATANFPEPVSVIGRVGTVGRPRFMPKGCWVNNNAAVIAANAANGTPEFIHLLLLTVDWSKATSVTAQPFLVVPALMGIEFAVPPVPEQTAIAAVLSDMDSELAALEARRYKTCDLKQAMMQELLTGKTRLVPAGVTHA